MGSIAFSEKPEECWQAAGWALRQVLDDTASQHPEDQQMATEFAMAKHIDGLIVYLLAPEFAARITTAIRDATQGVLSGKIRSGLLDQRHVDENTVRQYREKLRELLETIPRPGA
jgi:hypothetical protein